MARTVRPPAIRRDVFSFLTNNARTIYWMSMDISNNESSGSRLYPAKAGRKSSKARSLNDLNISWKYGGTAIQPAMSRCFVAP